jgi:Chaperone of endosialidase
MVHRLQIFRALAVILLIAIPTAVFAQVGNPSGGNDSVTWDITASGHDKVILRVSCADDLEYQKTFANGNAVRFFLRDLPGNDVPNGHCAWQLWTTPKVPAGIARKLADAREAGDSAASKQILTDAGVTAGQYQSGSFLVEGGRIFPLGLTEGDASSARSVGSDSVDPNGPGASSSISRKSAGGPTRNLDPTVLDQVIPDDLIVQSSLCVGFDCVDGESFNVDTIRMKENNTRLNFEDTSTSAGFASNDWRIIANDQPSGGANKFAIEDSTAQRNLMTIEAGAPANSLYVDAQGDVGIQQSAPGLDLHITTSDTPAMRYEQTNAGGFTAQTWDIGANEANFFVRDLTGGSRLSFRIRPGAPTSSIDIAANGKVGMGTASPVANLDVRGANAHVLVGSDTTDFIGSGQTGFGASNGTEKLFFAVQTGLAFLGSVSNTKLGFITNNATRMTIEGNNVGIGTTSPTALLHLASGASFSTINAGATQFTASSSRTFKDNIKPVDTDGILSKIEAVPVVTYDFKDNGPKDRMGLIAEDFHKVFDRGDEKMIDGHEVQMALWLAVQELTATNKALTERLNTLEKELVAKPDANQQ